MSLKDLYNLDLDNLPPKVKSFRISSKVYINFPVYDNKGTCFFDVFIYKDRFSVNEFSNILRAFYFIGNLRTPDIKLGVLYRVDRFPIKINFMKYSKLRYTILLKTEDYKSIYNVPLSRIESANEYDKHCQRHYHYNKYYESKLWSNIALRFYKEYDIVNVVTILAFLAAILNIIYKFLM
jgi:hypothetical protein